MSRQYMPADFLLSNKEIFVIINFGEGLPLELKGHLLILGGYILTRIKFLDNSSQRY